MIAKLIVKGRDRAEAVGRMKRALEMFVIEGIKTSIRCIGASLPTLISGQGKSIRISSSGCWERNGK